jgi:hypothetical protein
MNNRKRTPGRKIQSISVPKMIKDPTTKKMVPNPRYDAGKVKQVRHFV